MSNETLQGASVFHSFLTESDIDIFPSSIIQRCQH